MKNWFMKIMLAFLLMLTNITPVFSQETINESLTQDQAKVVQKALVSINTSKPFEPGENETEPDAGFGSSISFYLESDDGRRLQYSGPYCYIPEGETGYKVKTVSISFIDGNQVSTIGNKANDPAKYFEYKAVVLNDDDSVNTIVFHVVENGEETVLVEMPLESDNSIKRINVSDNNGTTVYRYKKAAPDIEAVYDESGISLVISGNNTEDYLTGLMANIDTVRVFSDNGYSVSINGSGCFELNGNVLSIAAENIHNLVDGNYTFVLKVPNYVDKDVVLGVYTVGTADDIYGEIVPNIKITGIQVPVYKAKATIGDYTVMNGDQDISDKIELSWVKIVDGSVVVLDSEAVFGTGKYGLMIKYTHANKGKYSGEIDLGFGQLEEYDYGKETDENGFVVDSKDVEYLFVVTDISKQELTYSASWDTKTSFYEGSVVLTSPVFKTADGKVISGNIVYSVNANDFDSLDKLNAYLSKAADEYDIRYVFTPDQMEDYSLSQKSGSISVSVKAKGTAPDELVLVRENGEYRIYSTIKEYLSQAADGSLLISQNSISKKYDNVFTYTEGNDYLSVTMPDLSEFGESEMVLNIVVDSFGPSKDFVTNKAELLSDNFSVGKLAIGDVVKPSAISVDYGTLLSKIVLEQNNSNGFWKFKNANDYVGNVGVNLLDIVFEPHLSRYYESVSDKLSVTVNKVDLTVIPEANQSKSYGDVDPVYKYSLQGLRGNDTVSVISGALTRESGEGIGTYKYLLGTLSAKNYNLILEEEYFSIVSKTLSDIKLDVYNFVYDGNKKTVNVVVKDGNNALTEGIDYVISDSSVLSATKAGSYSVNVTGKGNYSFSKNLTWTITKAAMSGVTVRGVEKAYDSLAASVSVSGYPDGTVLMYSEDGVDYQYSSISMKNAGEKTVWVKLINDNYDDYVQKAVIKISKKAVQPVVVFKDREYDGTVIPSVVSSSLTGIVDGDLLKYSFKAEYADKNVGSNKKIAVSDLKFTGGNYQNYYFDKEIYEFKASILPKEISAEITKGRGVYGEVIAYPSVKLNGIVSGDNVKAALIYKEDGVALEYIPKNAGTYTVSASIVDSNYKLVCEDQIFVIEKANNTALLSYQGFMYDAYDANVVPVVSGYKEKPKLSLYFSENASLDELTEWSSVKFSNLNPGKYYVVAVLGETDNYKKYISSPLMFEVSLNDKLADKVKVSAYNGIYDKKEHSVAVSAVSGFDGYELSYSSIKNGAYSSKAITRTDAGSTKLYVKISKFGYQDVIIDSSINIEALEAKLAWSDTLLTYNGKYQLPSAVVSNLFEGDSAALEFSDEGNKNAGQYTVSVISISNSNYKLPADCLVSYVIEPYAVSISADNTVFVYDGTKKAPDAIIVGMLEGDKVKLYTDDYGINAGSYTAKYVLNDSNYVLKDSSIDYVIMPKKLEGTMVSLGKYGLTYNGSELDIVTDNLSVKDDNLLTDADYYLSGITKAVDYGDYEFKVTGKGNYQGEVVVKWSIGKAQIEGISCKDLTVIYDGKSHMPEVVGLGDKDVVTYALSQDGSMPEAIEETELSIVNSGVYEVFYKVVRDGNRNHSPFIGSVAVRIDKLPVVTAWSNLSYIFDGKEHNPSVRINNLVEGDVINVALSKPNVNAGTYIAKIVSLDNDNYDLPVNNSVSYVIKPKDITISISVPEDNKYNSVSAADYKLFGLVEGYEAEAILTYKSDTYNSTVVPVNAGEYVVEASVADSNYNLTGKVYELFNIAKIDPEFAVPDGFKAVYGDKVNQIVPAISDFDTDDGSWSWKSGSDYVGNAGLREVTAVYTPKDTVNYNIVEEVVEVEVAKATMSVSHPDLVATYGDTYSDIAEQLAKGYSFASDIVLSDKVGNASDLPYVIKLVYTPEDTDNYNVVELECNLIVHKAYPIINLPDNLVAKEGTKLKDIVLENVYWVNSELAVSDVNMAIYHVDDNYLDVKVNVPISILRKVTVDDKELSVATKSEVVSDSDKKDVIITNDSLTKTAVEIVSGSKGNVESQIKAEHEEAIKEAIDNNGSVEVKASLKKAEIKSLEDKEDIDKVLASNEKAIAYLDLNVVMNISVSDSEGNEIMSDEVKVTQLAEPLEITVDLPEDFEEPEVDNNQIVSYFVLVMHEGRTYKIPAVLNGDGSVTFKAQQFSFYTLSYAIENIATGDDSSNIPAIAGTVKKTESSDGTAVTGVIDYVSVDGWTYSLSGAVKDNARTILLSTVNGSVKLDGMPDSAKSIIKKTAGKGLDIYVSEFFDLSLRDVNWQKVEKRATFTIELNKDVTKGLKAVYVLHMLADGSFECIPASLNGSVIKFTMNSQSPVAYVLQYGKAVPVVNTSAS